MSALGTDQNVTSHVTKWQIDAQGVRQRFQGRNRQQHDIMLKDDGVEQSIEELHVNGEDAIRLDAMTLDFAKNENEYLFVDFCTLSQDPNNCHAIESNKKMTQYIHTYVYLY